MADMGIQRIRTSGPYVPNVERTGKKRRLEGFSAPFGGEQPPNNCGTSENVVPLNSHKPTAIRVYSLRSGAVETNSGSPLGASSSMVGIWALAAEDALRVLAFFLDRLAVFLGGALAVFRVGAFTVFLACLGFLELFAFPTARAFLDFFLAFFCLLTTTMSQHPLNLHENIWRFGF
jgi:hypothetical protein